MIRFSKFTLNIKIYKEFVGFLSKLIWKETLFGSDQSTLTYDAQNVLLPTT